MSARVPDTEQYRDFSKEVKRIARDEFNYTYDEDPVNPSVAAFHEAVLLYAIVSYSHHFYFGPSTFFFFVFFYDSVQFLFGI